MKLRVLALVICCSGISSKLFAEIHPYGGIALGLGIQKIGGAEDKATVSQLLKAESGVQLTSFLTTSVNIYGWRAASNDTNNDDENQPVRFEGISGGWDMELKLPLGSGVTPAGPYLRYGGHCWAASMTGLAQPWSKSGCSDLSAVGFTMPGDHRRLGRGTFYFEFSHTRFDDVTSRSINAGIRSLF
ncbi:hypothetical protein [Bacterioplanoides pacificum]|uniref:Outer membrane protein beta-barrel domain-containing protein n=1 Tax=Bacterioplanoides pacificum TaxID=1171596 RepID=A0ABV7VRZ9_9GAMM